ncbi:MAG: CinA-like protein [Ignavibacteria bacterium]|nr:CinA-like protein [Ignavibacteria bacterium]
MKISILTIGDEILIGQITNTNASWLASQCTALGAIITKHLSVGDERKVMLEQIAVLHAESDFVIITGGLGPTHDDITKPVLTEYFADELVENKQVLGYLKKFFEGRGYKLTERNAAQAMLPSKCKPLFNEYGTAPGMLFETDGKYIVSLPGVPAEMKHLTQKYVLPLISELLQKRGDEVVVYRSLQTTGIPESMLADAIGDVGSGNGGQGTGNGGQGTGNGEQGTGIGEQGTGNGGQGTGNGGQGTGNGGQGTGNGEQGTGIGGQGTGNGFPDPRSPTPGPFFGDGFPDPRPPTPGPFLKGASLAFLPSYQGVRLRIGVVGANIEEANAKIDSIAKIIKERAGRWIFAEGDESLLEVTAKLLKSKGKTVSVAESCTGGMLGAAFTDLAGSSDYFLGGVIVYSNEAKINMLDVSSETIEKHGAVSEETARELAANVRLKFSTDYGISLTGIAGPSGGTEDKPVGTVWIGLADELGATAEKFVYAKERTANRQRFVAAAVNMIYKKLKEGKEGEDG